MDQPHLSSPGLDAASAQPAAEALRLKWLGIDTSQEAVIYMRRDCPVCRSEGFQAQSRVRVELAGREIISTLNVIDSELLSHGEASLSVAGWRALKAREGSTIRVYPAPLVESVRTLRAKIYGHRFDRPGLRAILEDVSQGRYSDIFLSAFITACAGDRLDIRETTWLTEAMAQCGEQLDWGQGPIADKHCVGGLPGNRTTLIVTPIIACAGLRMPKTSSRAITSPAGTADTMETLAPVALELPAMRRVVEREGACIVWGGAVALSPADDVLIRVERPLDLDSEAQLVASVISKKIAAGSTHVLIDIPIGATAKVRSAQAAQSLQFALEHVAAAMGIALKVLPTDGSQPVGRGIGPALEARDVLSVLRGSLDAPSDLRERALDLAGALLEFCGAAGGGEGRLRAQRILASGEALKKFVAICEAQGGFREPVAGSCLYHAVAPKKGRVTALDNRRLARLAKLAGAPQAAGAGIDLHVRCGDVVEHGQPLFTLHADHPGELNYARLYLEKQADIIVVAPI